MPGDFEFDDDPAAAPRRSAGTRRYHDELDEPLPPPPRRQVALSPLLVAGLVGGGAMFIVAIVVAILVVTKAAREEPATVDSRPATQTTTPAIVAPRPATAPAKKEPEPVAGRPTDDVVERVKKATVRVRVLFRNGGAGSGTGFVEQTSNKVLTNAHVLGLIEKKGDRKLGGPRAIELVVNSGEPGQYSLGGELLAADPDNDLAILRPYLLEPGARHLVPKGLVVPRSNSPTLLQRLFVFGYPFGEQLGAEITVSETSVSSLRKDMATGRLSLIQVKGGMNPGNSGGPVVDERGNVVGMAVAGIQNTDINFAIPGEIVHEFLAKKR